jgi:epoxyqueuosine reductase
VIRGTAYWAIGQLGVKDPEQWLERLRQCEELEPEEEALVELQAAIERLETIVASAGADRKNKPAD